MSKTSLALFLLAAPAIAAPLLFTEPCIPDDGHDHPVSWDVDDQAHGFPVGGTVGPGSVRGFEQDPVSSDDPMGGGQLGTNDGTGQTSVNLPVRNKDTALSGPNGEQQNGFGEGDDCIEVYLDYNVIYVAEVCDQVAISVAPAGLGASAGTNTCRDVYFHKKYRTPVKVICPCPETEG
jgi:hypothetical protein